jgi:hypothetical protein
MKKERTRRKKVLFGSIFCVILLFTAVQGFALKPAFNTSGWLLVTAEDYMAGRTNTGYYSMAYGVATWFIKYESYIKKHIVTYKSSRWWTTLPEYGWTEVTSEKLASLIHEDSDLGLYWVTQSVIDKIEEKMDADRAVSTTYAKTASYKWDPLSIWQWRSVYMEDRYSENSDTRDIHANCWGTADYLTRSQEWADAYPSEKAWAINNMDAWGATFPHIYLDGWEYNNTYAIDKDLSDHSWRFHLEGHGTYSLKINEHLNSFDVIRMSIISSGGPYDRDLVFDGVNLGQNGHCAAYLCTDMYGRYWFYEKGNYGSTQYAPYKIRAFGIDPTYQYETYYRSLFRHDYDYKLNIATSYDENWAGITP